MIQEDRLTVSKIVFIQRIADFIDIRGDFGEVIVNADIGNALHIGVLNFTSQFANTKMHFRKAFYIFLAAKALKVSMELVKGVKN